MLGELAQSVAAGASDLGLDEAGLVLAARFVDLVGDRARLHGLNVVGLRRRGLPPPAVAALKRAYRLLFHGGSPRRAATGTLQVIP